MQKSIHTNEKFQYFAKIKKYFNVRKLYYFYFTIDGVSDYVFEFLIVPANCGANTYTKISMLWKKLAYISNIVRAHV